MLFPLGVSKRATTHLYDISQRVAFTDDDSTFGPNPVGSFLEHPQSYDRIQIITIFYSVVVTLATLLPNFINKIYYLEIRFSVSLKNNQAGAIFFASLSTMNLLQHRYDSLGMFELVVQPILRTRRVWSGNVDDVLFGLAHDVLNV